MFNKITLDVDDKYEFTLHIFANLLDQNNNRRIVSIVDYYFNDLCPEGVVNHDLRCHHYATFVDLLSRHIEQGKIKTVNRKEDIMLTKEGIYIATHSKNLLEKIKTGR